MGSLFLSKWVIKSTHYGSKRRRIHFAEDVSDQIDRVWCTQYSDSGFSENRLDRPTSLARSIIGWSGNRSLPPFQGCPRFPIWAVVCRGCVQLKKRYMFVTGEAPCRSNQSPSRVDGANWWPSDLHSIPPCRKNMARIPKMASRYLALLWRKSSAIPCVADPRVFVVYSCMAYFGRTICVPLLVSPSRQAADEKKWSISTSRGMTPLWLHSSNFFLIPR